MAHASAAAETFAEQPKHARAVDKESATGFARGPSTQNDLFNNWAQKAAFSVRMVPRLKHRLDRILARGPVVIYSDHSGSGNGEEGLQDVLEQWVEASDVPVCPGSPVAWSCCDLCPEAQTALTKTSRCKHLFNRVEDFADDSLRRKLMKKLPKASDAPDKKLQKLEMMSNELSTRSREYFPPGRTALCLRIGVRGTATCLWSGEKVPVMSPASAADASAHDVIFHENVMRFETALLHDAFSDMYDIFEFTLSPPIHVGWPIRRPRRLTAMVRKDKWCCSANQAEFLSLFGREPSLTGSDLLCADDETVQEYMCEKLKRKGLWVTGNRSPDPKMCLTNAQRHRLEDCLRTQAEADPAPEDYVMDVTQNLDWTSVTQYAPLWFHRAQRFALPVEHLAMQGIPVMSHLDPNPVPGDRSWCRFIESNKVATDPGQDRFCLSLAGNGMHRPLMGTWMCYMLSTICPRQQDFVFQMRSFSTNRSDEDNMSDEESFEFCTC
ncbi:unnamed protein product [Symbiodinium sp. CCMP2592]|nr:unnamed protein product [Symbiodinium sp. CCMP2592]